MNLKSLGPALRCSTSFIASIIPPQYISLLIFVDFRIFDCECRISAKSLPFYRTEDIIGWIIIKNGMLTSPPIYMVFVANGPTLGEDSPTENGDGLSKMTPVVVSLL